MRRFLSAVLLAAAVLALAAPAAASSPWAPGTCTAAQDTNGHLYVTGSLPRASFTYDWGIYAPQPGGYSPEVGSGQFTSNADGTFTFTSPQTVAYYLSQSPPGQTALEFYAEDGVIHSHGYDTPIVIAACSYP